MDSMEADKLTAINDRLSFSKTLVLFTALAVFSSPPAVAQVVNDGSCNSNDPTAPCFAKIADILEGRRHLLRNDDLVLGMPKESQNTAAFENVVLQTNNLKISKQSKVPVAKSGCEFKTPLQVRVGRLFNLKNDVIVSVAPLNEDNNFECEEFGNNIPFIAFHITDTQDANNDSSTQLVVTADHSQIALADFNYDSFDDIFFINNQLAQVYTATAVNVPAKGVGVTSQLSLGSEFEPSSEPAVGDFNGDGVLDVAWLGALVKGNWTVFFASFCPAANVAVLGKTCTKAFEIILSSNTINVGPFLPNNATNDRVNLISGDYDSVLNPSTGLPMTELVTTFGATRKGNRCWAYPAGYRPGYAADACGLEYPGRCFITYYPQCQCIS